MTDRMDPRRVLAPVGRGRRRLILAVAAGLLLGAAVVLVVADPERGLALVALGLVVLFLIAQPHWGILAIFVLVIFRISPIGIGSLGTAQLLAAVLLPPFAVEILRRRQSWVWRVPQVRLLLGIGVVLLAATGWSMLMHPRPPLADPEGASTVLILFGQQFLFLLYLLYFVKTPRHLVYAVVVVLLMIVGAALEGSDVLEAGQAEARARVSQGWAANANRLAFLCVWGTALAWSLRFKGPRGWWRPLTLVPLLGLPVAALMTGSRSGLLQLLLVGGLITLEQQQWAPAQRARAFALMATMAVMVLVAAPTAMLERASGFAAQDGSVVGRTNTHWASVAIFAEHPLLGVGPGNFRWRNQALTGNAMGTHDSYLWALTAGGPLLLVLYLALFYRTYRMLRTVERHGSGRVQWLATGLRFNLMTLLAFSFFADMWLTHPCYLLLGLTIVLFRLARASGLPVASVAGRPPAAAMAFATRP